MDLHQVSLYSQICVLLIVLSMLKYLYMSEQNELNISNPGRSNHLIAPSEAKRRNPGFFDNRPSDVNWTLRIKHASGQIEEFVGIDWEATSRFGAVRSAVVTKPDGTPDFDRPRYDEAPSVNIVAWGKDPKTGEIRIAIISQARPHADNSLDQENTEDMVFEQIPMGFLDRVIGKDQLQEFEESPKATERELTEETGKKVVIKDISYPEYPYHYPSPTFVGTSPSLVFVEVDLEKIQEMEIDRNEQIFKAEYIPLNQLLQDIKSGKTERGYARMCTASSAILIFLSGLRQYQNAERNQKIISIETETYREFKKADPESYLNYMLLRSKVNKPEAYEKNQAKAEKFRDKLRARDDDTRST